MPHHQAHPLSVVAAIIATESKPAQTIVASNSIIGDTTAPRLRRSSHISPLTMLLSFVFGWISMPASDDHGAPGAGMRSRLQTRYEKQHLKIFGKHHSTLRAGRNSPPSHPPGPLAASPPRAARPSPSPSATAKRTSPPPTTTATATTRDGQEAGQGRTHPPLL